MDKRIIAIIIILIVGIGCMYYTVSNSNTVGNAITTFSKTIVTLPNGFSVAETTDQSAELYNKHTPEKINITDLGENDTSLEEFENALKTVARNPNIIDITNSTKTLDNLNVYTITYNTTNETGYCSFVYTYNHTYCITMSGYDDVKKVNDNLDFIIKTIHPDYKQKKD